MSSLRAELATRREEFDAHFALAQALEDRMMIELDASLGSINLSVRHINTIKSGLIIHLYNIEEALMSKALQFLGETLGLVDPRRWSEHSLKEWLRESIVSRVVEGDEDGRVDTAYASSRLLLTMSALGPQKLKKPAGSWDDKVIASFMRRMNVRTSMPPEMWRRIKESPAYGDETPLQFLARRRNAIAHGAKSFEAGANDRDLSQIKELANITLDYMGYTVDAFQMHIANAAHLSVA